MLLQVLAFMEFFTGGPRLPLWLAEEVLWVNPLVDVSISRDFGDDGRCSDNLE